MNKRLLRKVNMYRFAILTHYINRFRDRLTTVVCYTSGKEKYSWRNKREGMKEGVEGVRLGSLTARWLQGYFTTLSPVADLTKTA